MSGLVYFHRLALTTLHNSCMLGYLQLHRRTWCLQLVVVTTVLALDCHLTLQDNGSGRKRTGGLLQPVRVAQRLVC